MANIYKSKENKRKIASGLLTLIVAILIILGVWLVSNSMEGTLEKDDLASAENAIIKSAVQCYALEGQYPTGLKYLEDNYGLTLNREKYVYHYESIGSNIMPIVNVYPLD